MAIETTLNFYPYFPGNIDGRLGPYSSSAHATGSIESIYRYVGMTVFVSSSTETAEYWFKDGTTNNNLILKSNINEGPGIVIDTNNYISASIGAGLEFDGNDKIQAQVRTVNLQSPINGNIPLSITNTITGPSSSLSGSPFFLPDTYSPRPPISGTIFVVSGDGDPNKNGNAYIFVTSSAQPGSWQQIFGFNETTADARYVKLSSTTTQNITSSLRISGSTTFSGSILWSGSSTSPSTANVVVLSNGQLYVTGAYGSGGGATPGGADTTVQFNDGGSTLSGSGNFTFNKTTNTVRLSGSLITTGSTILSSSLRVIGTETISGSLIVSSSSQIIGTETITGSLIVSNSSNVIGTSRVTGSLIVSNSFQTIGTGTITGSLIVSSSTNLIGTTTVTGSLIVSSSSNVIGTSRVTGSLIISSSSQIIGTETITGSLIVSSSSNVIGTSRVTGSLIVSNSFSTIGTGSISGSLSISSSVPGQTVLQIIGTGSNTTAPMVQIAGQTGAFVQVYDFNSGSLFSVNSNTGNAIIDVISNGQTLIGSNTYQGMYDSTGYALMPAPGQVLTIPGYLTSSYNALWFEYFTNSGSYSRTGTFSVIWSGSTSASIDTTSSFLGSVPANNISFTASISGAFMQLIASASTNGWLIKGSIRGI